MRGVCLCATAFHCILFSAKFGSSGVRFSWFGLLLFGGGFEMCFGLLCKTAELGFLPLRPESAFQVNCGRLREILTWNSRR